MNRLAADLPVRLGSSSAEISAEPDGLQTFIDEVGRVVAGTDDEHEITRRVAKLLSDLLAGGYRLPPELTRPSPERHMTYPLYIAPDNSWSMASVVWNMGQRTLVKCPPFLEIFKMRVSFRIADTQHRSLEDEREALLLGFVLRAVLAAPVLLVAT